MLFRSIDKIRVPTLLMSACDDPFLPSRILKQVREIARGNLNLHFEFSPKGGHTGWIEGNPWSQRYYMEERVVGWLSTGK